MKTYLTASQARCLDIILNIAMEEGRPACKRDLEERAGVKRADWIMSKLESLGLVRRAGPKTHRYGTWWPVRTVGGKHVQVSVTLHESDN